MGGDHSFKYNLDPSKLSLIKKLLEPEEPRIQYKKWIFYISVILLGSKVILLTNHKLLLLSTYLVNTFPWPLYYAIYYFGQLVTYMALEWAVSIRQRSQQIREPLEDRVKYGRNIGWPKNGSCLLAIVLHQMSCR